MTRLAAALAALALAAAPAAASAAVTAGNTGWTWANPTPQGSSLGALAFAGSHGVAAGDQGSVIHTDDGGLTWSGGDPGTLQDLTDVAVPSAGTAYVAGGCVLRRSDDGGTTFHKLRVAPRESPCANPIQALAFPTPTTGYVFLRDGAVLRTTNGGRTFVRRARVPLARGSNVADVVTAAAFGDADSGVVAHKSFGSTLIRTADGGATWRPTTPMWMAPGVSTPIPQFTEAYGVDFTSPTTVLVAGDAFGPDMARSGDAGATWSPLPFAGQLGTPASLDCPDALRCVMTTSTTPGRTPGRPLFVTSDGGQTGTLVQPPLAISRAGAMTGAAQIVVTGSGGAVYRSADLGKSFARIGSAVEGAFTQLRVASGGAVYAFDASAHVARSSDRGGSWQAVPGPPLERLVDLAFADVAGFALGAGGVLVRSDDGGASWSIPGTTIPGTKELYAASARTLLAGTTRGVLRSADAGDSFARARGPRARLEHFDSAGATLYAYGENALLRSSDEGRSWRRLRRPSRHALDALDFVDAKHGWAVDDYLRVYRTVDGGRSWRPALGVGREEVTGVSFEDARHGYLALDDEPGQLLRTSDGGRTWRPQLIATEQDLQVLALGGGAGIALANETNQLLSTRTGGVAGTPSALTIAAKRRGGALRVSGRLRPAAGGETVTVSEWTGRGWVVKRARVAPDGGFSTRWKARGTAAFVAQWAGAPGVQGDGTPPLRVRLGRHKRR